jgi:hypothetical protein
MESTQMTIDWRASLLARFAHTRGGQRDFAREIGCSEPHLSLVLHKGRAVSYPLAIRISEKIGIPVGEIMNPPSAAEGAG